MMTLQPSEFAKIGLVVALAALLSRREGELDDVKRTLLPVAGLLAVLGGHVLPPPGVAVPAPHTRREFRAAAPSCALLTS